MTLFDKWGYTFAHTPHNCLPRSCLSSAIWRLLSYLLLFTFWEVFYGVFSFCVQSN